MVRGGKDVAHDVDSVLHHFGVYAPPPYRRAIGLQTLRRELERDRPVVALMRFRERMSPTPAALLGGLNGIVLKCHGGASDRDFAQALQLAADLARSDFSAEIERNMRRLPDALAEAVHPPAPTPAAEASQGAVE